MVGKMRGNRSQQVAGLIFVEEERGKGEVYYGKA
jgi:hypothetical protein